MAGHFQYPAKQRTAKLYLLLNSALVTTLLVEALKAFCVGNGKALQIDPLKGSLRFHVSSR